MPAMDAQIDTVRDLIAALGGAPVIAPVADVEQNTVIYWGRRDRIPSDHWDVVLEIAARAKPPVPVDRDLLRRVCRARKRRVG